MPSTLFNRNALPVSLLLLSVWIFLGCSSCRDQPGTLAPAETGEIASGARTDAPPTRPSSAPESTESAARSTKGSIALEITGLRNNDGALRIYLFDSQDQFPGEYAQAIMTLERPIESLGPTGSLVEVPFGEYAISVVHDEDNDGKLRTNFLGIPREGVGVSNNPAPRMGPPRWDDAKFTLEGDRTMTIDVQYP